MILMRQDSMVSLNVEGESDKRTRSAFQSGRYTIDPNTSKFAAKWDKLIAVALLYTMVVTPYEVGKLCVCHNHTTPAKLNRLKRLV